MVYSPTENSNGRLGQSSTPAVRYRPGEALRWLDGVAENSYERAKEKTYQFKPGTFNVKVNLGDGGQVASKIKEAANVLIDLSKSAYAELTKRRAAASEFTFLDDEFIITRLGQKQTVAYTNVRKFHKDRDKVVITLAHGSITIRPYAYIVAGKVRVPVGWDRNGSEVPYEVLFDEWSARCKLPVENS